mmetsp:Transcript_3802/g.17530  ORF Transcript_3802/g.17530 Transcript_3802/m.17530 type:complete len:282 (-) Transcript_3802:1006-1851(-)
MYDIATMSASANLSQRVGSRVGVRQQAVYVAVRVTAVPPVPHRVFELTVQPLVTDPLPRVQRAPRVVLHHAVQTLPVTLLDGQLLEAVAAARGEPRVARWPARVFVVRASVPFVLHDVEQVLPRGRVARRRRLVPLFLLGLDEPSVGTSLRARAVLHVARQAQQLAHVLEPARVVVAHVRPAVRRGAPPLRLGVFVPARVVEVVLPVQLDVVPVEQVLALPEETRDGGVGRELLAVRVRVPPVHGVVRVAPDGARRRRGVPELGLQLGQNSRLFQRDQPSR